MGRRSSLDASQVKPDDLDLLISSEIGKSFEIVKTVADNMDGLVALVNSLAQANRYMELKFEGTQLLYHYVTSEDGEWKLVIDFQFLFDAKTVVLAAQSNVQTIEQHVISLESSTSASRDLVLAKVAEAQTVLTNTNNVLTQATTKLTEIQATQADIQTFVTNTTTALNQLKADTTALRDQAAASASAAATSATNSANSATASLGSQNAANASQQAAATSELNAQSSAMNANSSKQAAALSEGNAATSASGSQSARLASESARNAAQTAQQKANDFANKAEDQEVEPGLYSAKHWSLKAAEVVDAGSPIKTVAGKVGDVVLTKNDVGLSNVNNTADSNKPVSTAQQAALDTKYDKTGGAINGAVSITTSGSAISLSIKNTEANGANLQLVGDGSTNPSKTIRAKGGMLEFINHAYSAVIASLSNTGQFLSADGFRTTTSGCAFDYQPGGTRLLIRSDGANFSFDAVTNNNSALDVLRFRGSDILFNAQRVAYEGSNPRFGQVGVGADADILLYESATNRLAIRTGANNAYMYSQFWENGDFTNSGKVIAGTDVTGNTLIARASTVLRGVGTGFLCYEHQAPHVAFYKKTGGYNYYWRRSDDGLSSGANTTELMSLNDSGNLVISGVLTSANNDNVIGQSIIGAGRIELNSQGSGDRYSYIDFHSDNTNTDYSARIMRGSGVDGSFTFQNMGVGPIYFSTAFGTQLYLRGDGWNLLNNTANGFKAYDTGNWRRTRFAGGTGLEVQNEQNGSKGPSDLQQAAYLAVGNHGGGYSMKDNAGSGNYYGGIWMQDGFMFLGCTAGNAVNVTKSTTIGPNGEVYLRGSGGNRGDFTIESTAPTITCYDSNRNTTSWIYYDDGQHGFLQDNSFAWAARRDTNNDWVCINNIIAYASDRRLKTNIFPASYAEVSRVIDALQVVEFDWNPEAINRLNPGFNPDARHETGGIAQQFRSIEPRFVSISSVNGVETIKWDKLSPYMLMEIQKHKADKQQMQQEINELRMAVAMLMEKLK